MLARQVPCLARSSASVRRILRRCIKGFGRRTGAFICDAAGIAAVEFSLIVPAMIVIFVATGELANALETSRKTGQFTRTIADLFGRTSLRNAAEVDEVFEAVGVIMQPYGVSKAKIRVNAMGVSLVGTNFSAKACSSVAQGTSPRARGTSLGAITGQEEVPAGFSYDKARYILVEVTMPYTPVLGQKFFTWINKPDVITFNELASWPERPDEEIVLPGGQAC